MIIHKLDDHFIELTNKLGMKVTLCNRGASLYDIVYNGDHMMASNADHEAFLNDHSAYYGSLIGPWAGRIKDSVYHVDGKAYHLTPNEAPNVVHSGDICFAFMFFDMSMNGDTNATRIVFTKDVPANEKYPATCHITCTYTVYEKMNKVRVDTEVKLDGKGPLRVLHHNYYNLGGYPTILDHELFLDADEVHTYEGRMIPTGYTKVDKVLDFSSPKRIGEDILDSSISGDPFRGYDHGYRFKKGDPTRVKAVLVSDRYMLGLSGDYEAVQIYSNNYIRENNLLSSGNMEQRFASIAIEMTDPNSNCEEEIYGTPERPVYQRYYELTIEKKETHP